MFLYMIEFVTLFIFKDYLVMVYSRQKNIDEKTNYVISLVLIQMLLDQIQGLLYGSIKALG